LVFEWDEFLSIVEDAELFNLYGKDPNDITGPAGYGSQSFILVDSTLAYLIRFENMTNATAPAIMVTITNQISPLLDYSTFQFGDVGFGTNTIAVPPGLTFYETRFDARAAFGLYVDIRAEFDAVHGAVLWTIRGVDPVTGLLPTDPYAGFLPPNTNSPCGEGWVRYTVRPTTNAPDASKITAAASIVFDYNEAIGTPTYTNTIDALVPSSWVEALPTLSPKQFVLSWDGHDASGSGLGGVDIYGSRDGGTFSAWWVDLTNRSVVFTAEPGIVYRFFSVATDNVGNQEILPGAFDAQTTTELWITRLEVLSSGDAVLGWESATNKSYEIWASTNLAEGFTSLATGVWATPPTNVYTLPAAPAPRQFYRIRASP
jgi:hypothetical protein